ncbi:FAD-dependent oxidoreductase [Salinibacterium sp. SYSU T00001]|uniref:protoporphyrinogen/coproporphyrinogen oxidase n=1 Tax=Homoserinimonas sedimenticola TaxID=2986805 RepID=UPI002236BC22|nr:FAD-dependent oxidoreductase [Salinibacterium sedimenticola]MCW4384438.1 FAD-dependent oxidoreductase [Salinibacterium sedimenticola]
MRADVPEPEGRKAEASEPEATAERDGDAAPDADCIVVGGGIAGLVAARELVLGGCSVILLEASSRLGGKLMPHTANGLTVDAGAESFATRRGTVADLAERLGLGDDVELPQSSGAWLQVDDATAAPLPVAGMLGIPSVPLAADVIAIVGLGGALRAQLDALLPGFVGAKERTLGSLVRRRMGSRVVERLVAPVTMGVHSRHPDSLDVDVIAPGLRAGLKAEESLAAAVRAMRAAAPAGSAVAGIRGGVSRLVTTLEAALARFGVDVRLDSPVTAVDAAGVALADGTRLSARAVVLAAPQPQTAEPDAAQPPIVLAILVVRSAQLDAAPRGSGVLVGGADSRATAKALTHATAKWAWLAEQAGPHRHVLRLSYDGARVEGASDEELRLLALRDASHLLGVSLSDPDVLDFARVTWVAGTKAPELPEDGITRVGETAAGTGLAAVVAQAQNAARRLVQDFNSRRDEGMIEQ